MRWQSRQAQACTRFGCALAVTVSAPHRHDAVFRNFVSAKPAPLRSLSGGHRVPWMVEERKAVRLSGFVSALELRAPAQAEILISKPPKIMRLPSNGIFEWSCIIAARRLSLNTFAITWSRCLRDL